MQQKMMSESEQISMFKSPLSWINYNEEIIEDIYNRIRQKEWWSSDYVQGSDNVGQLPYHFENEGET